MNPTFNKDLEVLSRDLSSIHIAVLGDIMIDRYITGSAFRISPEAPVPVVLQKQLFDKPGGASNVAANLKSMGCKVSLIGLTGQDENAFLIKKLLEHSGCDSTILIEDPSRPTTVKTRVMADGHQITRIDVESEEPLSSIYQNEALRCLESLFAQNKPEVLILQDYNKGFLHSGWISKILDLARIFDVRIAVDPKKKNFFEYNCVDLFKPNLKEALQQYPGNFKGLDQLPELSEYLMDRLQCKTLMITLASEGIWVQTGETGKIYPTKARKITDVSGAGDTVISLAAICKACTLSDEFMAISCNEAGGQVCEKIGVALVDKALLLQHLKS
ncbi:MAG: hypothetical protein IPM34_11795 [Saprospiraceae bacterium]|nr:hypothetical protein [Saprospiraceae bacterium]